MDHFENSFERIDVVVLAVRCLFGASRDSIRLAALRKCKFYSSLEFMRFFVIYKYLTRFNSSLVSHLS